MYGHVIAKFSRMDRLPHFFLPMVLRCARFARESFIKMSCDQIGELLMNLELITINSLLYF